MSDSKECKIIDTINVIDPEEIIQTPCGKFLIGTEVHSIYCYNLETRQKFRIAGSVEEEGYKDGTRDESIFCYPKGLTLSKDLKTLFVADKWNVVIRAICVRTGITTTFAGQVGYGEVIDGPKEKACFKNLRCLKLSPDGNTLSVSDHCKLRTICIGTGQVRTIDTFKTYIYDFTFSPDSKHIFICVWNQFLKYNLETRKYEILLQGESFDGFDISKDGHLLFISTNNRIRIFDIVKDEVIDTITTNFEPCNVLLSSNNNQLYVCYLENDNIQVFDISKYCTNFKTFIQSQLFKHSFLPRQVITNFSI